MLNIQKITDIRHQSFDHRKFLPSSATHDKVLQYRHLIAQKCITLSRSGYGRYKNNRETNLRPFLQRAVLDDKTADGRTKLFHSVSTSISGCTGILQQFHSQRKVVYTEIDSEIQSQRHLVIPRHWFFQSRQFNQYPCGPHRQKSCGSHSRTTWRNTPLSLPHIDGSTVQEAKAAKAKGRAVIYLFERCLPHGRQATASTKYPRSPSAITGRNSLAHSGRIYSQSRCGVSQVGQNNQGQMEAFRYCCPDKATIPPVLFKKNDVNRGLAAWQALKSSFQLLHQEVLPGALFQKPPTIRFAPAETTCDCGSQLVVQKTRRKTVQSLAGPFIAHETLRHCTSCSRIYGSEALRRQVPKWCNVGYDVLVYIGRALFQRHRTAQEVSDELYNRNVLISNSEISYLGYKFITYLATCHQQAAPEIRQSMMLSGGYILHLDATHEGGAPALMTGMDSLSEIVLGNIKIPTEHADHISPFLRRLQNNFGTPQACVHDMGKGICKAIAGVFPKTPDFICHFHFLRDIGKDFLEPAYSALRLSLRRRKVGPRLHGLARELKCRLSEQGFAIESLAKEFLSGSLPAETALLASAYSMVLWLLRGKHNGDGYGFPFDRPLLTYSERLVEGQRYLTELSGCCRDSDKVGKKTVNKLTDILSDINRDDQFQLKVKELNWRTLVFDELRQAMRIAPAGGKNGLNDDGTAKVMPKIKISVQKFRCKLSSNKQWAADKLCKKMAEQIDKWQQKLFSDPIEVLTPNGSVVIYPQRTNNIMEQFFRRIRRGQRRKTGNNSIRQMLQAMLADTPLVKNLDNKRYMTILLGQKKNLEELFADLDQNATAHGNNQTGTCEQILPGFKKIIAQQSMPKQVADLLGQYKIGLKSN
jgi:hypothetical protein